MVKHIILWTLNPELSDEQKEEVKKGIKAGLESLKGVVPGCKSECRWSFGFIKVRCDA